MSAKHGFWLLVVLALTGAPLLHAQEPVRLSVLIRAFLADSGVATRGMSWSTGNTLPVRWATRTPVTNPDRSQIPAGLTHARSATAKVGIGPGAPVDMTLAIIGNSAGIQRTALGLSYQADFEPSDPKDRIEKALAADGIVLTPLKCDRKKEGLSFGNVVYTIKAPGKIASALWMMWNCAGSGACGLDVAIVYRRSELSAVECYSG